MHPLSITLDLSDTKSVTLLCEANEALSYRWERENGDIPPGADRINSCQLVIDNLSQAHSGKYRCVAYNRYGRTPSNYATVSIPGRLPNCVNTFCLS